MQIYSGPCEGLFFRQIFRDYIEKELGISCVLEGDIPSRARYDEVEGREIGPVVDDHYMKSNLSSRPGTFVSIVYEMECENTQCGDPARAPKQVKIEITGYPDKYVSEITRKINEEAEERR